MRLRPNRLRLVSRKSIEKNGKIFTFARFANTQTYEMNDFLLARDLLPDDYPVNTDYDVTIDIDGKFVNVVEMKAVVSGR